MSVREFLHAFSLGPDEALRVRPLFFEADKPCRISIRTPGFLSAGESSRAECIPLSSIAPHFGMKQDSPRA